MKRAPTGDGLGRVPRGGRLPEKTCARCGLPFTWRRKWARDWEQVRYCSDRCRRGNDGVAARRNP